MTVGLAYGQSCSIPGQSGTNSGLTSQPNTFFPGAASVSAGATSMAVGAGTGLASAIMPGDLLLIIQMQGADISAVNSNAYGSGVASAGVTSTVAYGAAGYAGGTTGSNFVAGTYEWALATGGSNTFAGGGTINVSKPLLHNYYSRAMSSTQGVQSWQVIRVPQYANVTLASSISVLPWNGSSGGVLVLDASGDINLAGQTINGVGAGFRGAGAVNVAANSVCTSSYNTTGCQEYMSNIADSFGASKGEGVAGTPARLYTLDPLGAGTGTVLNGTTDAYPGGEASRGAPANAGGGGNQHNAGGGGGANGGAGGNGGNSWNSSVAGDYGLPTGGFGGAPSNVSATSWLLGGGGGAGDIGGNTTTTPQGSGGAGGGLVVLRASRVVGAGGQINVSGAPGITTYSTDGSGGGGAGGTVVIAVGSAGVSGALSVMANGGAGGAFGPVTTETDGPGGGGGGGVLVNNLSTGSVTFSANGGLGGASATTAGCGATSNACGAATGFANAGAAGYAITSPGVEVGYECLPNLTVTKSTLTPTISTAVGATAAYVINVTNTGGGARFVNLLDWALPPGWTLSAAPTYAYAPATQVVGGNLQSGPESIVATGSSSWAIGATPLAVPSIGANSLTWSSFAMAPVLAGVPSSLTVTFVASIPDTASVGTYQNGAGVSYLDPTRPATTATVTPLSAATANRTATPYSASYYANFAGSATNPVQGANYNGLVAGPTSEDVTLLPDLSLVKTGPATVIPGATFTYTLTPHNNGRAIGSQTYSVTQASDVPTAKVPSLLGAAPLTVTDTLPAGISVSAFSGVGWTCSGSPTVVCTLANSVAYPIAAATDFPAVSATATVTETCYNGVNFTNTAVVSSAVNEPASATANNRSSVATTLGCVSANLTISKTDGLSTVASGSTTAYSITVANLGPGAAAGAVLQDPATPGLVCTNVTCSSVGGASCPASLTVASLQGSGLAISPSFPAASSVTFVVVCGVTATGL